MRARSERTRGKCSNLGASLTELTQRSALLCDSKRHWLYRIPVGVLARAVELAFNSINHRNVLPLGANAWRIAVVVHDGLATRDDNGAAAGLGQGFPRIGVELGVLALVGPTVVGERVPRAVVRRLHEVVLKDGRIFLVAIPLAILDEDFSIAASKELDAVTRVVVGRQGEIDDDTRLVFLQALFHLLIVAGVNGRQQVGTEHLRRAAGDCVECLIHRAHDGHQIVGLAVDILAHDLDAVAVRHCKVVIPVQFDAATRFLVEGLGVIAQSVILAGAAEHDRRGPQLADHDLLVFVRLLVVWIVRQGAKVEVASQAAAVVLVGVAQQEGVNVRTAIRVLLQLATQIVGDVADLAVWVVGVNTNVHIDEDGACVGVAEADQRHVAIGYREERNCGARHIVSKHAAQVACIESIRRIYIRVY